VSVKRCFYYGFLFSFFLLCAAFAAAKTLEISEAAERSETAEISVAEMSAGETAAAENTALSLENLFPSDTVLQLVKTGRMQRSFYGKKNVKLELFPDTQAGRDTAANWDGKKEPVFIVESLYLIPVTDEKNTADINDVSLVLRSFSKMTGMRYYSNSRKRYETLYTDVHCVNNPEEKKSVPDPLDVSADALVSYVYQKDRSLSGCVYRFSFFQTQNEIGARAVNTDEVQYKGFSILKPEHLVLNVHAVQTKEGIVFYILVRADAAKIPLVSEKLAKSYGSRADAIYEWCVSLLKKE
jgi:hypothetical protein